MISIIALMAVTSTSATEVQTGIWKIQVGVRDAPTLTDATGSAPRRDRLLKLGRADLPFALEQVSTERTREHSVVSLPLAPGEKIFGLGLQMEGANRRGGVYHLRVDHYAGGHDRLHVPTPLYVSSLGYAVFFNTSRPVDVYVGVGNRLNDPNIPKFRDRNSDPKWDAQPDSGRVEARVSGPGLEILVFAGPSPMNALQRYNLYCGGGAMPPRWALGFWNRTPLSASASSVTEEVAEFARRKFPLDVIGLEPGWQSSSYPGTMEWSLERFPKPAEFISQLKDRGIHVNLWENPYVAPGSDLFKKVDPAFGSHTVWLGAVPDLRESKAREALAAFHTSHHLDLGVSGYKVDEVDGFDTWLWPDHATFPSGLDGIQMREIYGMLWQKEIDGWFRKKNLRTFGLVRSSNGAASRFPFAIYSDTYDHRQYVTALSNSSLAGTLWCAEARDASTPEEWVRRMQSACLSPIAQLNAWSSGLKPWSFPSVENEVRDAMMLREELTPYLYTAFAQYWLDGVPPIRPMCLVDGGEETDQYLLGDDLLVAPAFAGELERKVRLPKGKWFDFNTGILAGDGETITVHPGLGDIPIYVRENSAIPMYQPLTNLQSPPKTYQLRCFGAGPWQCSLYEDDGITHDYEKSEFGFFDVSVARTGDLQTRFSEGRLTSPPDFHVVFSPTHRV